MDVAICTVEAGTVQLRFADNGVRTLPNIVLQKSPILQNVLLAARQGEWTQLALPSEWIRAWLVYRSSTDPEQAFFEESTQPFLHGVRRLVYALKVRAVTWCWPVASDAQGRQHTQSTGNRRNQQATDAINRQQTQSTGNMRNRFAQLAQVILKMNHLRTGLSVSRLRMLTQGGDFLGDDAAVSTLCRELGVLMSQIVHKSRDDTLLCCSQRGLVLSTLAAEVRPSSTWTPLTEQ
jgi:hypothetical protein